MPGLCEDMWNKVGEDWQCTLPSLPLTLKPFIYSGLVVGAGEVLGDTRYSWEFFLGVCRPVLQILTLFQTKNMSFYRLVFRPDLQNPYLFSDLCYGLLIDLAFRPKLHHHYLDSVCNPKNSSNAFRICIFLLLSYSFAIETVNMFIHSHSTLENHTRFQTKMAKIYTCF